MFNPAATVVLCMQQQQRARKARENKEKEALKNKNSEKEVEVEKSVESIIVTYEDGSKRVLQRGLALDLLNEDQAMLDCTNLKDEDILTFLSVLYSVGKEKGIIKDNEEE